MTLSRWFLLVLAAFPAAPPAKPAASDRLAELSREVLAADYRGNRPELAALEAELARLPDGPLDAYREYWRGFALWRRAMNGFNESPTPQDLASDLEKALARFQNSLTRRPDWMEARLGMVGCWGNLLYLAGKDDVRRKALLDDALPSFREVMRNAGDNPRALWIKGGMEMAAPPPTGGDFVKAATTLEHGVASAWREALSNEPVPAWEPRWGGPENLMDLAWLYSHAPEKDRRAALAYARGALTAVPSWHYVRDVLLPQIEALGAPSSTP